MRITAFCVIATLALASGCHRVKLQPDPPHIAVLPDWVPDDYTICARVTNVMKFNHPNLGPVVLLCGPTAGAFRDSLVHVLRAN